MIIRGLCDILETIIKVMAEKEDILEITIPIMMIDIEAIWMDIMEEIHTMMGEDLILLIGTMDKGVDL